MSTSAELAQLQLSADSFALQLDQDSWFELMHWHPDIYGTGNADPMARQACTVLAKQYLTKVTSTLRAWPKPSQCWCLLDPADSSEDAVYVHIQNPNRANFPFQFQGVSWGIRAPAWVAAVFPEAQYLIGSSGQAEATLYWVVEKGQHEQA